MLAALRDFGPLEGAVRKRLTAILLGREAFAPIDLLLHDMGVEAGRLVTRPDSRHGLLGNTAVERLFLECHQRQWVRYQVVGVIDRIDF